MAHVPLSPPPTALSATTVDLSTIVGRIVGALRQEMHLSQSAFSTAIRWDRSLLARIETGRNTANADNMYEAETIFIGKNLLQRHGDIMLLAHRVAWQAKDRGLTVMVGNLEKPEGEGPVEVHTLDRIVSRVIDDWLEDLKNPPCPTCGATK